MMMTIIIIDDHTTTVERDVNRTGTMTTRREGTDLTRTPPAEWTSDIITSVTSRHVSRSDITTSVWTTPSRTASTTSPKPTVHTGIVAVDVDVVMSVCLPRTCFGSRGFP